MPLSVVILAAGQGKRMNSDRPKVLQPLAGRPLLGHVIERTQPAPASIEIVYGHGGEQVRAAFAAARWAGRCRPSSTARVTRCMQAMPSIPDEHLVLVLYGDVPLMRRETLADWWRRGPDAHRPAHRELPDPTGYGRIVRDGGGSVLKIVEQKDATTEGAHDPRGQHRRDGRARRPLRAGSPRNANAQGEYYLTDIVEMAVAAVHVQPLVAPTVTEVLGVNDKLQLAEVEAAYRTQRATALMLAGVTLADPLRIDVRGTLETSGATCSSTSTWCSRAGEARQPRAHRAEHRDPRREIGDDTEVFPSCVIDRASIGARCNIGPFARFRPSASLADGVHIGNFVEVKNSTLGAGAKANHLAYVGDATVGARVNIGAGTIVCNYDGANKHRTEIGAGASPAPTRCWSRRSRSARAPPSARARPSPRTRPPASSPSRAPSRSRSTAGSAREEAP